MLIELWTDPGRPSCFMELCSVLCEKGAPLGLCFISSQPKPSTFTMCQKKKKTHEAAAVGRSKNVQLNKVELEKDEKETNKQTKKLYKLILEYTRCRETGEPRSVLANSALKSYFFSFEMRRDPSR